MTQSSTFLIIDAGNTRIKVALYTNEILKSITLFDSKQLDLFISHIKQLHYTHAILSSVLEEKKTAFIQSNLENAILFENAHIPLNISYDTPLTLGADRIANAVALKYKCQGNRLGIDIGTCLKFDFVDEEDVYQGGSISPGMNIRFKALNHFTGKLPLLEFNPETFIIGKSTKTCIETGVIMGMQEEINGFISKYEKLYPNLTIFVTGGDHLNFDYSIKKDIFADPNLTIWGLFQILKTNV